MKTEVFQLLLDFHLGLIRAKPKAYNINKAAVMLIKGAEIGSVRTDRLENSLLARMSDLMAFHNGDWNKKVEVYNKNYKAKHNPNVFDALKLVLHSNEKIGTATAICGVNFQSVKVLKPRFERYIDFSVRLDDLLNGEKGSSTI
jgi:hypothetical protein